MKRTNPSPRTFKLSLFLVAAMAALSSTNVNAQTINIGPNQYAFRFTQNQNYGLFFNATDVAYDFRNGSANAVWSINANNGELRNDLQFAPGFTVRVPAGAWAARSASAPNAGIFFGNSDFEFRIADGSPGWSMNAFTGNSTFAGTVSAQGGSSTDWNQAYSWGDHASAGYMSGASLSISEVPRWTGSELAASAIKATASSASITGAPSTITSGTSAGNLLVLENPGSASVLNTSESRLAFAKNGVITGRIATSGNNMRVEAANNGNIALLAGGSERMTVMSNGNIGVGPTDPQHKLDVAGTIYATNTNYAIRGVKTGTGTFPGVWGETESTSSNASGVRGYVTSTAAGTGSAGVHGRNYSTTGSGMGVKGTHDGNGWGVYGETIAGRGVYGLASAGASSATAYGLFGQATGGTGATGTRIGVYGVATGGSTNWAGYFAGNQYVSGDLRVGTIGGAAGYKLSVNGKAICTEMRVQLVSNWPDYVFDESYEKLSLDELEQFISTEKHLPNIPSAQEIISQGGIDVGEMQRLTIEKVEELTLYLLELKRTSDALSAENAALRSRIEALEK